MRRSLYEFDVAVRPPCEQRLTNYYWFHFSDDGNSQRSSQAGVRAVLGSEVEHRRRKGQLIYRILHRESSLIDVRRWHIAKRKRLVIRRGGTLLASHWKDFRPVYS
jgi:hypothetical protein